MNKCVYSELSKRQGKPLTLLSFKTFYGNDFLNKSENQVQCLNSPCLI